MIRTGSNSEIQCFLWDGPQTRDGYGLADVSDLVGDGGYHRTLAHRAAWWRSFGPIPEGLVVHHFKEGCSRLCIELTHLELVDKDEHDRYHGFQKTDTCIRGHARTSENLWYDRHGNRQCRLCWNARRHERRQEEEMLNDTLR